MSLQLREDLNTDERLVRNVCVLSEQFKITVQRAPNKFTRLTHSEEAAAMDALRKQASKLREQVAKQQQVFDPLIFLRFPFEAFIHSNRR